MPLNLHTGSWIGAPNPKAYAWLKDLILKLQEDKMCDKTEDPRIRKYNEGMTNMNSAKAHSSEQISLRTRLLNERSQLQGRLSMINQVLDKLTPEMENSLAVQEMLMGLGYR